IRTTDSPAYFSIYPRIAAQVDRSMPKELQRRLATAHVHLGRLRAKAEQIHADQPASMTVAGELCQGITHLQLTRADAGRGDGSEGSDLDSGNARRAS